MPTPRRMWPPRAPYNPAATPAVVATVVPTSDSPAPTDGVAWSIVLSESSRRRAKKPDGRWRISAVIDGATTSVSISVELLEVADASNAAEKPSSFTQPPQGNAGYEARVAQGTNVASSSAWDDERTPVPPVSRSTANLTSARLSTRSWGTDVI